ncbi:unnamed protein product [Dicrocoelium dendriticum]|nr:unnamed protein product [Dicrocoelium dendriticum]
MYTNVQGLLSKITELRVRQVANALDVISIPETWLHQALADVEDQIAEMSLIRYDRPTEGAGVLLYYRSDLQCTVVDDREAHVIDTLLSSPTRTQRCISRSCRSPSTGNGFRLGTCLEQGNPH